MVSNILFVDFMGSVNSYQLYGYQYLSPISYQLSVIKFHKNLTQINYLKSICYNLWGGLITDN